MQKFKLIRSKRKTVAIEIHPDRTVLVRAPLRAHRAALDALVAEKQAWIDRKLEEMSLARPQAPLHQYVSGEAFPYLGIWYALALVERIRPAIELDGSFNLAKNSLPRAAAVFTAWYRRQALEIFAERVAAWSRVMDLHPSRIRISSARTRWGSCSSRGSISLTWRLVMAPPEIIDYVVVHELAHLKERNHSAAFWKLVAAFMPDYAQKRRWLKENGRRFDL